MYSNIGAHTAAFGARSMINNISGSFNTVAGFESLAANQFGFSNTAVGAYALSKNLGSHNTALGTNAGNNANGTYNILIGAHLSGADESHTMRLGKPYEWAGEGVEPAGINRTFIAGIRGTSVTGASPVGVYADGQLGMADKLGAGYGCATCYQNGTIELHNPATGDMTLQSEPAYRLLFNPAGGHVGVGSPACSAPASGSAARSAIRAGSSSCTTPAPAI